MADPHLQKMVTTDRCMGNQSINYIMILVVVINYMLDCYACTLCDYEEDIAVNI